MKDRRPIAVAQAARADLLDRIGPERVLVGAAAAGAVGVSEDDAPLAVVRPADAGDVSAALRVARARHLPVVVRAALPCGRPAALREAIVLDCAALSRPPAVDISRRVVSAGVGVPLASVDRAARRARLALRAAPAFGDDQPIGALIAGGEAGEIGLGSGELAADLVSAVVVTGSGRVLALGPSELIGHLPWALGGLPDPCGLMRGAEGRLAVLVEVTLRLVPAPWTAWAEVPLPGGRLALLAALSAARAALTPGLIDSALLDDDGREGGRRWLRLRARSERDEDDLTGVIDRVEAMLAQHALAAAGWQAEGGAARTGQRPPQRPWQELAGRLDGDLLDLRLSWPDAPKVLDVVDALAAGGKRPVRRLWSFGQDGARLRLLLPTGASARHPLRAGAQHLLDAGAVPVRAEGALRELLRERMPSAAKVLLAALARVWDPDDLLVTDVGPF